MKKKTRISIDYTICGDGNRVDPRQCSLCLKVCEKAIFTMHQTFGAEEKDPFDPQIWRITPFWLSLCTRCMKCVDVCPEKAIKVLF
jgi:formate hydrogenlyase subunit 6/NADH:ubiquinone oxidoreductase subunit I